MSKCSRDLPLTRRALSVGALVTGLAMGLSALLALLFPRAAEAAPVTVRGEVVYRERMALPRGVRVEVQLADVSKADAPARVLATGQIGRFAGSSIPFTLRIDSKKLVDGRRYVLQARILDNRGKLLFINDTSQPWKPGDAGPVTIQVVRAGGGAPVKPARPREPATAWGRWIAEDIQSGGVLDHVQSLLVIAPDGKVTGHGGCNSLTGTARVKGRRIVFSRMASTMMACPPAQMNQERRFNEALGLVRSFRVASEQKKLLLLDGSNRVVLRFAAD